MTDYEPNDLKMILHTTKMLCEMLIRETEHKVPGDKHEVAEMLLKAIREEKRK
jgi:hypothetical protein